MVSFPCLARQHRSGWMTILGDDRIVWQHDGEFKNDLMIYLRMHEDGSFEVVKTSYDGKIDTVPKLTAVDDSLAGTEALEITKVQRNATSTTDKQ